MAFQPLNKCKIGKKDQYFCHRALKIVNTQNKEKHKTNES